ncbi:uncharacterized protein [Physcomitrium patens]|uniref:Uncharacterized protein n=1 Tax=Physcomitrium patens TaxID=3218 RepID=A0A2K1IHU5_PHYPA|nr:uncharacterized protein LOC112275543 [Physcomitrium patens]PNR28852.1 hypothetical protein PHYPA_027544 [Physcomitrium patens]|eukprot:XP_024361762.1 uncharacterized protein LOC112275543 [Physcomitrella patens]
MAEKAAEVSKSVALFVAAGLCEIGGGWLVWKWRRECWHWGYFVVGSAVLIVYGILPTLQSQSFGRVYAAYGGFFILLSFLWAWAFDHQQPDRWDLIGSAIALGGVCVVMFTPRITHDAPSPAPSIPPYPA